MLSFGWKLISLILIVPSRYVQPFPFSPIRALTYLPSAPGTPPPPYTPDLYTFSYRHYHTRDLALISGMGATAIRVVGWSWDDRMSHSSFLDLCRMMNLGVILSFSPSFGQEEGEFDVSDMRPASRTRIENRFRRIVMEVQSHPSIIVWMIGDEAPTDRTNVNSLMELSYRLSLIRNEECARLHNISSLSFSTVSSLDCYHPLTTPLGDAPNLPMNDILSLLFPLYHSYAHAIDIYTLVFYHPPRSLSTLLKSYHHFQSVVHTSKPLLLIYGADSLDMRIAAGVVNETMQSQTLALIAHSLSKISSSLCIGGIIDEYVDEWYRASRYKKPSLDCHAPKEELHEPPLDFTRTQYQCGWSTSNIVSFSGRLNRIASGGGGDDGFISPAYMGLFSHRSDDCISPRLAYHTIKQIWALESNSIPPDDTEAQQKSRELCGNSKCCAVSTEEAGLNLLVGMIGIAVVIAAVFAVAWKMKTGSGNKRIRISTESSFSMESDKSLSLSAVDIWLEIQEANLPISLLSSLFTHPLAYYSHLHLHQKILYSFIKTSSLSYPKSLSSIHLRTFESYNAWALFVHTTPIYSQPLEDILIYMCIWSSVENLRRVPSYVNLLYHNIAKRRKSSKKLKPPSLETIISPKLSFFTDCPMTSLAKVLAQFDDYELNYDDVDDLHNKRIGFSPFSYFYSFYTNKSSPFCYPLLGGYSSLLLIFWSFLSFHLCLYFLLLDLLQTHDRVRVGLIDLYKHITNERVLLLIASIDVSCLFLGNVLDMLATGSIRINHLFTFLLTVKSANLLALLNSYPFLLSLDKILTQIPVPVLISPILFAKLYWVSRFLLFCLTNLFQLFTRMSRPLLPGARRRKKLSTIKPNLSSASNLVSHINISDQEKARKAKKHTLTNCLFHSCQIALRLSSFFFLVFTIKLLFDIYILWPSASGVTLFSLCDALPDAAGIITLSTATSTSFSAPPSYLYYNGGNKFICAVFVRYLHLVTFLISTATSFIAYTVTLSIMGALLPFIYQYTASWMRKYVSLFINLFFILITVSLTTGSFFSVVSSGVVILLIGGLIGRNAGGYRQIREILTNQVRQTDMINNTDSKKKLTNQSESKQEVKTPIFQTNIRTKIQASKRELDNGSTPYFLQSPTRRLLQPEYPVSTGSSLMIGDNSAELILQHVLVNSSGDLEEELLTELTFPTVFSLQPDSLSPIFLNYFAVPSLNLQMPQVKEAEVAALKRLGFSTTSLHPLLKRVSHLACSDPNFVTPFVSSNRLLRLKKSSNSRRVVWNGRTYSFGPKSCFREMDLFLILLEIAIEERRDIVIHRCHQYSSKGITKFIKLSIVPSCRLLSSSPLLLFLPSYSERIESLKTNSVPSENLRRYLRLLQHSPLSPVHAEKLWESLLESWHKEDLLSLNQMKDETFCVSSPHFLCSLDEISVPSSLQRRIGFFFHSLHSISVEHHKLPPSLSTTNSLSILIPLFNETILVSAREISVPQIENGISILEFLVEKYKQDWMRLCQRIRWKEKSKGELLEVFIQKNRESPGAAAECDICGSEWHFYESAVIEWSSMRSQTLARTVRGLSYYPLALSLYMRTDASLLNSNQESVRSFPSSHFQLLIAAQSYSNRDLYSHRSSMDQLMTMYPHVECIYDYNVNSDIKVRVRMLKDLLIKLQNQVELGIPIKELKETTRLAKERLDEMLGPNLSDTFEDEMRGKEDANIPDTRKTAIIFDTLTILEEKLVNFIGTLTSLFSINHASSGRCDIESVAAGIIAWQEALQLILFEYRKINQYQRSERMIKFPPLTRIMAQLENLIDAHQILLSYLVNISCTNSLEVQHLFILGSMTYLKDEAKMRVGRNKILYHRLTAENELLTRACTRDNSSIKIAECASVDLRWKAIEQTVSGLEELKRMHRSLCERQEKIIGELLETMAGLLVHSQTETSRLSMPLLNQINELFREFSVIISQRIDSDHLKSKHMIVTTLIKTFPSSITFVSHPAPSWLIDHLKCNDHNLLPSNKTVLLSQLHNRSKQITIVSKEWETKYYLISSQLRQIFTQSNPLHQSRAEAEAYKHPIERFCSYSHILPCFFSSMQSLAHEHLSASLNGFLSSPNPNSLPLSTTADELTPSEYGKANEMLQSIFLLVYDSSKLIIHQQTAQIIRLFPRTQSFSTERKAVDNEVESKYSKEREEEKSNSHSPTSAAEHLRYLDKMYEALMNLIHYPFYSIHIKYCEIKKKIIQLNFLPRTHSLLVGKLNGIRNFPASNGKSENQSHALPFVRGNIIQTIDMNQDCGLEEALKIRLWLTEFKYKQSIPRYLLIGAAEHCYSENISTIGQFAAMQDLSFTSLVQRMLTYTYARSHYGHPDGFDAFWIRYHIGMSKSSINNLSEDVYFGFDLINRGGGECNAVEYIEYGKGREVGIVTTSIFESKLSRGAGLLLKTSDIYRMMSNLNILQHYSWLFGSLGHYVFSLLFDYCMTSFLWIILIMSISQINSERIGILGSVFAVPWILHLGYVFALPLLFELLYRKGIIRGTIQYLTVLISGFPYYIFHLRTKSTALSNVLLGITHSNYTGTGRNFELQHYSLLQLYLIFSNTHHIHAMKLLFLLLMYVFIFSNDGVLEILLKVYTIIIAIFSWIFIPIIYTPTFSFTNTKKEDQIELLTREIKEVYRWCTTPYVNYNDNNAIISKAKNKHSNNSSDNNNSNIHMSWDNFCWSQHYSEIKSKSLSYILHRNIKYRNIINYAPFQFLFYSFIFAWSYFFWILLAYSLINLNDNLNILIILTFHFILIIIISFWIPQHLQFVYLIFIILLYLLLLILPIPFFHLISPSPPDFAYSRSSPYLLSIYQLPAILECFIGIYIVIIVITEYLLLILDSYYVYQMSNHILRSKKDPPPPALLYLEERPFIYHYFYQSALLKPYRVLNGFILPLSIFGLQYICVYILLYFPKFQINWVWGIDITEAKLRWGKSVKEKSS